ncbi:MAG: tRNA dihydrouridine synthase DusB [Azospirillaceae bacterium]
MRIRPPLQIGPITVDSPAILAPMSGISDRPFRQLVRRLGGGLVISEMIASRDMLVAAKEMRKTAIGYREEHPVAIQLAGYDPQVMAEAARYAVGQGAVLVDLNFGCPAKKVTNRYCGSALMQEPALAGRIMKAVVAAVEVPVTVKMRTGWDDENRNAPEIAAIAEAAGIAMLTVHGRTRAQKYKGHADWSFIARVKQATRLPVIANGDIRDLGDVDRCLAESGADGVMIGRGAEGRPWFVAQAGDHLAGRPVRAAPSPAAIGTLAIEHYEAMLSHYGCQTGVRVARKHLAAYVAGFRDAASLRARLATEADPRRVIATLGEIFHDRQKIAA